MTVKLSPIGNGFQFFTTTGIPLSGGLLYTYDAGTTTPRSTYTTSAGNVAHANPIVLGTDGRPATEIWLTEGYEYKFVLKDSDGVTIQTYDNLYGIPSTSGSSSSIPSGVISLWYGSIGLIPSGWVLCDGNNATPDLRDRFIVGAGTSYTVNQTGGSSTAVLPEHTHTASVTLNDSDPGHSHTFYGGSASTSANPYFQATGVGTLGSDATVVSTSSVGVNTTGITFDPVVTVDDAGVSPLGGNLPPFYALAYIMKV